MIKNDTVIALAILAFVVITVLLIIVSAIIDKAKVPNEAAGVIIVDPQHKVVVYDTENGRSWQAFKYQGTLVLIPGTEVQE